MGAKGEKNKMHKITEKQVIAIRHLYKNHKITQMQLAATFKVSQHAISDIVNGATWRDVEGPRTHGTQRTGSSKLTPHDVALIRVLRKENKYKLYELADMFDISKEQITRVIHRKSWVHVLETQEEALINAGVHPLHPSVINREEALELIHQAQSDAGHYDDPQDYPEPK
jgi:DNA-binding MarR family transcriptional regulator